MASESDPIPFHRVTRGTHEAAYVREVLESGCYTGDGPFLQRCRDWIESHLDAKYALLTGSCTHALELAALVANIGPGDEVIMASFAFPSTANAFVMRGARVVFVDIDPETMNLDPTCVGDAITPRTRAIVPLHYAGVACDMDALLDMADAHGLTVIEDAAQGFLARHRERALGTIGTMGAISFHATKHISSAEGGVFLTNDDSLAARAAILREKGTNRQAFLAGEVDKYSWVDLGSSYVLDEVRSALLWAQLEEANALQAERLRAWQRYYDGLQRLEDAGYLRRPVIPPEVKHNAHLFYIKCRDSEERSALIHHLRNHRIQAVFHFVPLHTSRAGRRFGRFVGEDRYTTGESERLLRLPLFHGIRDADIDRVVEAIECYYNR